jgi:hypothetical protein
VPARASEWETARAPPRENEEDVREASAPSWLRRGRSGAVTTRERLIIEPDES